MRWVFAAVLAVMTGFQAGCEPVAGGVEVGRPMPDYGAATLAGAPVRLAELEGTVVLLNVWATWCVPCREEIPALQELYERNAGRGFEVVGVSVDGRGETAHIQRFANEYGVSYPIWHDPEEQIYTRMRIFAVPVTFLIDRQGVLRWHHLGPVTVDDPRLTAALEEALAAT